MPGPTRDTVINWFTYHPATPRTGPQHDHVRSSFRLVANDLWDLLPDGPDKTLALRKLQEAMMSANACIANDNMFAYMAASPNPNTEPF